MTARALRLLVLPLAAGGFLVSGCAGIAGGERRSDPPLRASTPDLRADDSGGGLAPEADPRVDPLAAGPLAARCARVCAHVLAVSSPGEPSEPHLAWIDRCESACLRDASPGQLDCFERVKGPGDLAACGAE